MLKKKNFLLILILVLGLSLTACGSEDVETDVDAPVIEEDNMDAENESSDTVISDSEYQDIEIMPEEAFDIFIGEYSNAKVKELQLEKEMNKFVYKIEGFEDNKEYELEVDSNSGKLLELKSEIEIDDDRSNMEITRSLMEKINPIINDLLATSEEESKLKEWTVEIDDGYVKLEIEIDKKGFDDLEYTYNLETGELMELDD